MIINLQIKENKIKEEKGFILPVLLITGVMIVLMIIAISSATVTNKNVSVKGNHRVNAQLAADAGLDYGMNQMNTVPDWTGTGGEITLMDDVAQKIKTTYQVVVTDGSDSTKKTLTVTARTYFPSTNATPTATRKYDLDIKAVTSGVGITSVVTGVGGLLLNSNSKITGGDVVVNGTITVNNNAQIGLSSTPEANAVNIRVAHTNCPSPADATYPRVCANGENGEPITVGTTGYIYANVQATNQTNGSRMFNPGLIPNQTVPPTTLPDYDRDAQKAAVVTTIAPTDSTVACGNNQTKTWPANLKITGNITMGNNCTINLSGNVWITGNLTFGNNSKMIVPSSAGTTTPVIMVDGSEGLVIGNNGTTQANSSGTGVYFIAYWSNSSCSPDCTSLVGTDLKNSQDQVRINLENNGSAPGSILYARWSRVRVSNNGAIGAVAGQSIELGNNAVINFTSSVPGSSNLKTTWVKRGYMRVYN
ncbi:hypothetical protein H0X09_00790 [Candidatus Saccharibacteria bacterium]|nr:hypothetical protein [Candidatus Saccharibacteria bacterium]